MPRTNHRPSPAGRGGMTILEVLFAIMITTIGLLGAVAVFPVASEYARKGRLKDEVTVCTESAVHMADTKGMRRPDHWITWRFDVNSNSWQMFSGQFPGMIIPGESYCLDPRFLTYAKPGDIGNLVSMGNPTPTYGEVVWFPAFPRRGAAAVAGPVNGSNDPNNGGPGSPRMQRITLVNGFPGGNAPYLPQIIPMSRLQADNVFSFPDQLSYERPGVQKGAIARADNASPAFQLYSPMQTVNGTFPGKREDDGKLSWMATLVPKIDRWNGSFEDKYVLSIVVFYGRSPSLAIPDFTQPLTRPINEWSATILGQNANGVSDFHSNGFGGGEVTISISTADPFANDKLKMRAGDWIMLSGHARFGGTTVPNFKWYRISDADEDPRLNNGYMQRDVTLVGPDWDLQDVLPFNMGAPGGDGFPDDVDVTIVPNVVSVFDRTIRLERDGPGY